MKTQAEYRKSNLSGDKALTYHIYEDNAGVLSMEIYEATYEESVLVGTCNDIKPAAIRACISSLDIWETWEGLVPKDLLVARHQELVRGATLIAGSQIVEESPEGLTLLTTRRWDLMGCAGRKAFAYCDDHDEL